MFTETKSDFLCFLPDIASINNNLKYSKNSFSKIIKMDFNGLKINIPIGYNDILTSFYGNYMNPVQISKYHNYPLYKKQKLFLESIK